MAIAGLVLFLYLSLFVLGMPIAISIAFSSMMTLLLVIPFDASALVQLKMVEVSTVFRSSLFRFSFFRYYHE